jgi:hypothetical protein
MVPLLLSCIRRRGHRTKAINSELDHLLMGIPNKGRLVGFDVVEVMNPYRDPSGRTAQTAVRLMIDLLGAAFPEDRLLT